MRDVPFEEVAAFVVEQLGVRLERVTPAARVENDLGCTGDDASELLEAFAAKFAVDLAGIEVRRHFGHEGCMPFLGFYWRWRYGYELGADQVTVADLHAAARAGRWLKVPSTET